MNRNTAMRSFVLAALAVVLLAGCERPPMQSAQRGFRGTGMVEIDNPRILATQAALNTAPAPQPAAPDAGPKARDLYKSVRVLGDLSVPQFLRQMNAIASWVAPVEGCVYCHNLDNYADDSKYTKRTAREMLKMTQFINANWKNHVQQTGVTCYTCHRGRGVPADAWVKAALRAPGVQADNAGQNVAAPMAGLTAMGVDPVTPYLRNAVDVRITGPSALPLKGGPKASLQATEATYALMIYISQSMGVNCNYCHDSRQFPDWSQGSPQRVTAWHGIRQVRDLNKSHIEPLSSLLPAARLGPTGDVPKVGCATCHQGAYKPLYGANMVKDYPILGAAKAN